MVMRTGIGPGTKNTSSSSVSTGPEQSTADVEIKEVISNRVKRCNRSTRSIAAVAADEGNEGDQVAVALTGEAKEGTLCNRLGETVSSTGVM